MEELDHQADDRMKSVSDLMQRRDADVNNRMMELVAIIKDLALGVKAVLTQLVVTPDFPPLTSSTSVHENAPSTSAFPPQGLGLGKVASQSKTGPSAEHIKQTKLKPTAMFKKMPERRIQIPRASQNELKYHDVSGRHRLTPMPEVLRRLETFSQQPVA